MPNNPSSLPSDTISGIPIPDISKRTVFFTEVIQKLQDTAVEAEYRNFLKHIDTVGKYLSSEYPQKSKSHEDIKIKVALRITEVIVSGDVYDMTQGNADNAVPLILQMNLSQLKERYSHSREKINRMRD
jgi:hypothetical protein